MLASFNKNASLNLPGCVGLIVTDLIPEPFTVTFAGTSKGNSSMYVPGKMCNSCGPAELSWM